MANLRPIAEILAWSMFHGLWAEILYGQGFEKNLQQFSISRAFFNSFPQIVHKVPQTPRLRPLASEQRQVLQALRLAKG